MICSNLGSGLTPDSDSDSDSVLIIEDSTNDDKMDCIILEQDPGNLAQLFCTGAILITQVQYTVKYQLFRLSVIKIHVHYLNPKIC